MVAFSEAAELAVGTLALDRLIGTLITLRPLQDAKLAAKAKKITNKAAGKGDFMSSLVSALSAIGARGAAGCDVFENKKLRPRSSCHGDVYATTDRINSHTPVWHTERCERERRN